MYYSFSDLIKNHGKTPTDFNGANTSLKNHYKNESFQIFRPTAGEV